MASLVCYQQHWLHTPLTAQPGAAGGTWRQQPRHQRRQWRLQSATGDGGGDASPPASSGASGSESSSSGSSSMPGLRSSSPWELMGRVVREERLALQFDRQLNLGLVRSAAARESELGMEEFEERLQRLLMLMPFLQERILRMSPKLLAALAADPDRLAARLIQLKGLLPAADVAAVAGQRPSLLLDGEWERVAPGAAALAARFGEAAVARLVATEPLLLVEDLEGILEELQRLMPQQPAVATLLQRPQLATQVGRLSHLSLWFAGTGGDAQAMLLRDPSLLYRVQRGSRSLGPGAELM